MKQPYRIRISKGIYHIGHGYGGGINSSCRYSKESMEDVKNMNYSYYNESHGQWKFVEIKEDGKIVEVS
jgi:hypothetical protein